jgi:hypothetical protein
MRCCQNKTNFSWSYRDSSRRSLENNVISKRGREKYTDFEIGGHVQMAKSDPEAQRKSSLSDCTWLKKWVWILNLETFEIPNALLENQGVHFILFLWTHIYFFFSHTYFFFIFFFFSLYLFFFFSFLSSFFYLLPLNSKLHCTYLLPHA